MPDVTLSRQQLAAVVSARRASRDRGQCAPGLGWPLESPPLQVSRG